ncbi:MAG TPA: cytochrome-c oxidase, cbb3-type subunit III [Burkholderiales bacterium]|nr:cytochrome-c oxidase, cbb3-type subunit III [Burkholderiales bacterium]
MSDFTSGFWSGWVTVLTLASVIGCAVLLWAMTTKPKAKGEQVGTTGHVWDEDLAEWNNPLPGWWKWLFYITVVFALVYLWIYPGLGSYKGSLDWSSLGQYQAEVKKANETYGPLFDKYKGMTVEQVAVDPQAREMGQRLYLTYCVQCHGSDAKGARGFPNLADGDWLYGGTPEQIKTSITEGRNGVMPPMAAAIGGDAGVKDVANYVLSLSGQKHDAAAAAKGKQPFETVCGACHGPDGKGNQAIGAPNLTDKTWLYGGSEATISETVNKGRQGAMPTWKGKLDDAKIHLLTAYVWGLSNPAKK